MHAEGIVGSFSYLPKAAVAAMRASGFCSGNRSPKEGKSYLSFAEGRRRRDMFQTYYGYPCRRGTVDSGGGGGSTSRLTGEMRSAAACKSHSEAEKKRRERINGHLARLRTLLPNLTKKMRMGSFASVGFPFTTHAGC
ncbi:hypothetical protein ACLOJK_016456 [Asimina triloba]